MCQITPFTLPCCRRIYVTIKKLPSCPKTWPRSKCPPELCIQIGGYEFTNADHKQAGICWRCKASLGGTAGCERERLRPEIDTAVIVPGLDELGLEDRRKLAEADGTCWFCDSKGCDICAGGELALGAEGKPGTAAKRQGTGKGSARHNKRLKTEAITGMTQRSSPVVSKSSFQPYSQPLSQQSFWNPNGPYGYACGVPPVQMFGSCQGGLLSYPSNIDPGLFNLWPEQYSNTPQHISPRDTAAGGRITQGSLTEVYPRNLTPAAKQQSRVNSTPNQVSSHNIIKIVTRNY